MVQYQWRITGFPVDATEAAEELERIREASDGKLTPARIVECAEPKDSVLHPCFEWRNVVAARKYREWQARQVVKSIRIERPEQPPCPVYVHVKVDRADGVERYYQRADLAIQRPDEWMSAITEIHRHLSATRDSLDALTHLATQSENPDRAERIAIAAIALDTLQSALRN